MKFIFTGDLHLSKYSNDKINKDSNLPERLHDINIVLCQMADYAINNEIKNIIISGDIFHNKSIIHSIALNVFLSFIRKYKNLQFIVLDGNHDLSNRGEDSVSALACLDYEPNVHHISKPLEVNGIFYVPYYYGMIEDIKNNSSKYLISHFGLNEGMLNSGISVVADIAITDLIGKYETVLLGHYHKPQEIIRENIRLYYTGSIIELDYGERNDEKRFLVVDTETNNIESIFTYGYKKHYAIELTSENRTELIQRARELQNQGHHVQIVQTEEMDVSDLHDEFKIVSKVIRDITNRGITSSMSMKDKLLKYLEIKNISSDLYDEYLDVAFEIINDCSEEI